MKVAASHVSSAARMNFWQRNAFAIVNAILAVGFLVGGGTVTGMELLNTHEAVHRWHQSELLALAVIVLGGTLMAMLWRPLLKPLLAQFFVISIIATVACIAPFEPKALAALLVAAIFVVAYPDKRALLGFSREGKVSMPLLGISILIAIFLLPTAWHEMELQAIGMKSNDVHALLFHWAGSALLMILLVIGGFLAATKRAGWKELGTIVGGTFCYLGLIAMIIPMQTGSWGGASGLYAISIGIWYMLFTFLEARNTGKTVTEPVVENSPEEPLLIHKVQPEREETDVLPEQNTRELAGVR